MEGHGCRVAVPCHDEHRLALQDIFSLFHLDRSFKFISKTSNFYIPIVGWSMFMTGACAAWLAHCLCVGGVLGLMVVP